MAWNGSGDEESGLELSLGLPGYFSGSQGQAGGVSCLILVLAPKFHSLISLFGLTKLFLVQTFRFQRGEEPWCYWGKRMLAAAAPVVGWPPVRSFRRNLASSSSSKRPPADPRNGADDKTGYKGLFVKVNMDGVPIGRKVDLQAHGSYVNLSVAVDRLFRDLLAAQRNIPAAIRAGERDQQAVAITGLLDGSGEYTLVYEDDEGDQMLVGDVPWDMFIATAKRLRVLRSSDLNAPSLRAALSRKRGAAEC
ncbi:hypothetical protein ACQ4PT_012599 [Festuca glaucescens]